MKIAFLSVRKDEFDLYREKFGKFELFITDKSIEKVNISRILDVDILSVFVFDRLDSDILSKFKNLRLIVTRSSGFDHIDIEYCKEKGISVAHMPGYSPKSIAEHTFAMLLSLVRNIKRIERKEDKLIFYQDDDILGEDLFEKSLGVIGTGKIGFEVARLGLAFGMIVYAYDIKENEELKKKGVKYISIDELIQKSDVITLHIPYNPSTHHLINEERIEMMKDGVIFLNTARGSVVDTDALYDAVMKGKIKAAGLDVFEEEEILILGKYELGISSEKAMKILKLRTLDNVIITPHIAYFTKRSIENIKKFTVECIKTFIEKGELGRFKVV
ncbi:NAD(P)-dependent oxidoreductase [Persephonella sp.]